ncbi:11310_t:CDS:2, partial [Ambispora gerdemannii]
LRAGMIIQQGIGKIIEDRLPVITVERKDILAPDIPNQNNANTRNSHQQNNIKPNASNRSANNGQTNNNTNAVLLMQIQQLTDALQNGTTSNNSLLATHEYLAGERKAKTTTRHNPLEEFFNQSSEEVNNIQSSEQQLLTLRIPDIQETFSELFEYFQTIRKKLQCTEVDFNEESVYNLYEELSEDDSLDQLMK